MHTLYKDHLLDHYRYPRNSGIIPHANCTSSQENPACGDAVSMAGRIHAGILQEVSFTARGCVISVASASLLSDQIKGHAIEELQEFDAQSMIALLGISIGPTRLKCALLPLYALHDGVKCYTKSGISE